MFYLKIKWKAAAFLILFSGLAFPSLTQRKTIEIDFSIEEKSYLLFYGDSISGLETKAAQKLATRLQTHIPFIHFSTDDNEGLTLHVVLDRQKTGLTNPFIHRIDMNMELVSPEGIVAGSITQEFRSEERFDEPLPNTNEAFVQGLDVAVDFWFNLEKEAIIDELFSKISLGEKAHPDPINKAWALPFSENGLSIGQNSELRVSSKIHNDQFRLNFDYDVEVKGGIPQASSLYPSEYRGNMLARLKDDKDVDRMGEVQIEGIYLMKFIRAIIPLPEAPDDSDI